MLTSEGSVNRSRAVLTILLVLLFVGSVAYCQQVRDRKKSDDDILVVPKGTRIQTDIAKSFPDTPATPFEYDGKVEIPVRLGFTTAIPAGSRITVRIYATYAETGYQYAAKLIAVTVDGTSYRIRTDRLPVEPSTVKEVSFTLLDDLNISR